MGTGEVVLATKMSGREKLDHLAGKYVVLGNALINNGLDDTGIKDQLKGPDGEMCSQFLVLYDTENILARASQVNLLS